jgi:hypothetical protein
MTATAAPATVSEGNTIGGAVTIVGMSQAEGWSGHPGQRFAVRGYR